MSSYINFYLKVEDKYCPLGSYSRNCSEYQFFKNFIPYEELAPLTLEKLADVKEDVEFSIGNKKKAIIRYSNDIELIKTFNNPVEDKMELIENHLSTIEEIKEDLEADVSCLAFIHFLTNILTDIGYDAYAKSHDIKADNYLWAGIDVGIK